MPVTPDACLPSSAVRLTARAGAGGWTVEHSGDGSPGATIRLSARVRTAWGSQEVAVVCRWLPDGEGALHFSEATLLTDGHPGGGPYRRPEVASVLAGFAPDLVDPGQEASGLTRHGRTAGHWQDRAGQQYELVLQAAARAGQLRTALLDQRAAGVLRAGSVLAAIAGSLGDFTRFKAAGQVLIRTTAGDTRTAFAKANLARRLAESCAAALTRIESTAAETPAGGAQRGEHPAGGTDGGRQGLMDPGRTVPADGR